jgi:dihydrofolate synthase/folylpolyglutamate synthase
LTYEEALAFLGERIDFERFTGTVRPGNERIRALMDMLQSPQAAYPSIHVTGTNGKYSTVAMATAILGELGMTVGTYTSPHIEAIRERIAVGGTPIDEESFGDVLGYLRPYIETVESGAGERLTHFDTLTAMAFEHFFDRAVHAGVIEVGLGGEYDATNVLDGRVSVITRVSRDHIPQFGEDLTRVAWEKAGVIKKGAVALSGVDQAELAPIVAERAREKGAERLALLGSDFGVWGRRQAVGGQVVTIKGLEAVYDDVFVPLYGEHQAHNAAFAVAGCEAFVGEAIGDRHLRAALEGVRLPGRFELVSRRPAIVLDGGHNEDAARAVIRTLVEEFTCERLLCVIGMLVDKQIEDVLGILQPEVDKFFVSAPPFERAAAPRRLVDGLQSVGVPRDAIESRRSIADALELALSEAGEEDMILVFGSFHVIGEARPWLRARGLVPRA